jgi:hypothetical protein
MNSGMMAMTTTMRAKMRVVMTTSLNLKAYPSHVCRHEGKRKLAQKGMQQRHHRVGWSCLGAANGSKQLGNGTMAMRGAPSAPNGLFVGSTVGVKIKPKAMVFVRLTVGESDASMQVGVERVLKGQLRIALPMAGASDASMQVGVERVLQTQLLIARLTVGARDASTQVDVERVPKGQLLIARLTVAASDASMQVGVARVL